MAEHRKDRAVRYLRTIGCKASGFISGENLVRAVRSETAGRNYDQVIVPTGRQVGTWLARVLRWDPIYRLRRRWGRRLIAFPLGPDAPTHALVLVRRPHSPYRSDRWKRSQHPERLIRRSRHIVQDRPVAVRVLGRHSRVCPHGTGVVQRPGNSIGGSHGGTALVPAFCSQAWPSPRCDARRERSFCWRYSIRRLSRLGSSLDRRGGRFLWRAGQRVSTRRS